MSLYRSISAHWRLARASLRLPHHCLALSLLLLVLSAWTLPQAYRLNQSPGRRQLEAPAAEWLARICPHSHLEVVREFPLRVVATVDCPPETYLGLQPALTGFYDIHEERGEGLLLVRARPPFAWVDHRWLAMTLALTGLLLLTPTLVRWLQHLRTAWNNRPVKPVHFSRKPGKLRRAAQNILRLVFLIAVGLQCLPLWVLLGPLLLSWRSQRQNQARQRAGKRPVSNGPLEALLILKSYPPEQARKIREQLKDIGPPINTYGASRSFRLQVRETFAYHLEQVCEGTASDEAKIAQTLQQYYFNRPPQRRRVYPCAVCDEVFIDAESKEKHELTHGPRRRSASKPRLGRARWLGLGLALATCGYLCLQLPASELFRRGRSFYQEHTAVNLSQSLQDDLRRFVDSPAEVATIERDGKVSALIAISPQLNPLVLDRASELGLDPQRIFFVPAPKISDPSQVVLTCLGLLGVGYWLRPRKKTAPPPSEIVLTKPVPPTRSVVEDIPPDPLAVEVGRGLLSLVDPNQGARLLDRVTSMRRHMAGALGIVVPGVRFRDNLQLKPNEYLIKVRNCEVARGEVVMNHFLAIGPEEKLKNLRGTKTVDPTYGMPGVWISPEQRSDAERLGCMIFDPVSVVSTQLTEMVRACAPDLLTYNAACHLLRRDTLAPLLAELERYSIDRRTLWMLLRSLLEERVCIRDLERICEALLAIVDLQPEPEQLLAYARRSLGHTITSEFCNNQNQLHCWEIPEELQRDPGCQNLLDRLREIAHKMRQRGLQPVFLSGCDSRRALNQLPVGYGFVVLAMEEIPAMVERVNFQE